MSMRQPLLGIVALAAWYCCAPSQTGVEPLAEAPSSPDLWEQATLRFEPLPAAAPNPDNPITTAKVALGKALYYDTRLSKTGNVSCNSCHDLTRFGVDGLPTSPGDDGTPGDRNSPTVLNAALYSSQFWDGRARDVEEQAGMPILEPDEMGIPSPEFLVQRLASVDEYAELFAVAFPEDVAPLSFGNTQKALAAFERTLITPAPFDAYLAGNPNALNRSQKAGLEQFMKFRCATCHNGVAVGANSFQRFGLQGSYWEHTHSETIDEGRYGLSGNPRDKFVFRVASLRNVEMTAPYFHDGSVSDLGEAIRVMFRLQLGLEPSEEVVTDLTTFLRSLTGEVPSDALQRAG